MVHGEEESKVSFLSHRRRTDRDSSHTWLRACREPTQLDKRRSHNEHLDSPHKGRRLGPDPQALRPKNILRARREGVEGSIIAISKEATRNQLMAGQGV